MDVATFEGGGELGRRALIASRPHAWHDGAMRLFSSCLLALSLGACSPPAPSTDEAADGGSSQPPAAAQPAPGQLVEFQLPTGNIGCTFVPAGGTAVYRTPDGRAELACDRIAPTYVRIVLSETGAGVLQQNLGEAPCCAGETLAYGASWAQGPFTCTSSQEGVSCTNGDGHGLMLSRERAEAH